jgi:hypothetical protein
MRKPPAARIAATTASPTGRPAAAAELVCAALALALVVLACRIASIW